MQLTYNTTPISDFRAMAGAILEKAARGQATRVLRHGKPIADIVPVQSAHMIDAPIPSWKREITPLRYPRDKSLAQSVVDARAVARY